MQTFIEIVYLLLNLSYGLILAFNKTVKVRFKILIALNYDEFSCGRKGGDVLGVFIAGRSLFFFLIAADLLPFLIVGISPLFVLLFG